MQLLDEANGLAVYSFRGLRIVSSALLIVWLAGAWIQPACANDDVTLHLQWYHQFQFAGYYAAQEKGFFGEEGLDVTIVEGGPGIENFKAVLSAPGNYGTAHAAGLLLHRTSGDPLIVLASIFQHSPNAIIARADRGIRNPHDLVAERTVIWPGGHVELSAMLLNEGIDPAPFLHEVKGSHLQDLLEGRIDAIDGYVTNEAIALREAGVPIVIISPVNYGVDFYGDVLMTSERELREHPARARAFRAASLRGWKYALEHPEEIVELLVSEYAAKPSREHLLSEAEVTAPLVRNPLIEIGHTNPGRWQRMADTLAALSMAEPGIQAEDFLFDPNPDADLTKLYIGLGIALTAILTIGFVALVLLRLNRKLRREIAERKRAEEALKASRDFLEKLTNSMWDAVFSVKMPARVIEWANDSFRLVGYEPSECIGKDTAFLYADRDEFLNFGNKLEDAMATGKDVLHADQLLKRKNGENFPAEITVTFHRENDEIVSVTNIIRDITERKRAEELIAASLKEKEVLLREIHHRVKNNMQVIVSLLRMHSRRSHSELMRSVFDECRDRVNAMSLIHEALYQSEDLARIDFEAYLTKLCRNLSQAHGASDRGIAATVERCNVSVGIDQGVAIGMVICELVSNAFKHAFPSGKGGTVSVGLRSLEEEEMELIVQDDGIGLPEEIDVLNSPSLGLELVGAAVTGELGGSIEVERDGGTRFIIRFNSNSA